MDILRTIGTKTVYRIQSRYSEQGEEPSWQTCDASTDYSDALVKYNEFLNSVPNHKFRLISETVSIDVLEERTYEN